MTDLLTPARAVAAVKFKWQKDDRCYDYFIPEGMDLKPGMKVVVETKRGETEVEVVEIRPGSERAEKAILRIAEEKPNATEASSNNMDF